MTKELLEKRKQIKKRKPTYRRVQENQFAKFKNDPKWRRPKGMGNKDRKNRKGHIGTLKVGYGSPKAVKSMNRAGLFEALVYNVEDIKNVDNKTQIAVIGRSVGGRKRAEMLEVAKKQNIAVANIADIDKALSTLKESAKSKKKATPAKKSTTKKEDSTKEKSTQSKTSESDSDVKGGKKE